MEVSRKRGSSAVLERLRQGLFGVLFVMAKDVSLSRGLTLVLLLVDFLEFLSYPLHTNFWEDQEPLAPLSAGLNSLSQSFFPARSAVLFFAALVWVCSLLACAGWVAYCFIKESFPVLWPIRALRLVALVSTTGMYIPLTSNLTQVYVCDVGSSSWLSTGMACFGELHIVLVTLVTAVLLAFSGFSITVAVAFIDRSPRPDSFHSKSHGRCEGVMLLVKTALTVLFTFQDDVSPAVLIGACWAAAVVYLHAFSSYLPYYNQAMNRLQTAFAMVFLWATVCVTVAQLRHRHEDGVESFMFLTPLPFVAVSGLALATLRFHQFDKPTGLANVYVVDLKMRYLLRNVAASEDVPHGYSEQDLATIQLAEDMIKEVVDVVPTALMYLLAAHFMRQYRSNKHLELSYLAEAENRHPPLDVEFYLFQRRRQIRQSEATLASKGSVGVISRIRFEACRQEAEDMGFYARWKQVEFWREWCGKGGPNLGRLLEIGNALDEATGKALKALASMRKLNQSSSSVLRSLASLHFDVTNNTMVADKLIMEADEMDERAMREHVDDTTTIVFNAKGYALDASSDDVGVVTISSQADSLGEIVSVTAPVIRAFGYSRAEMVGKSISSLVPAPLCVAHQDYLRHFVRTGVEVVLNTTRTVFGRHKAGHIFPMYLNVRPHEDSFNGVLRAIPSHDKFMLVSSRTMTVLAACAESLLMMGVSAMDVEDRYIMLTKYLSREDFDEAHEQAVNTMTHATPGSVALMRKFFTELRNVSSSYRQAKAPDTVPLPVWVKLQRTNFGMDGTSFSDLGLARDADAEQTSIGPTPPKPGGTRTEEDNERVVLVTWNTAEQSSASQSDARSAASSNYASSASSNGNGVVLAPVATCVYAQQSTSPTSSLTAGSPAASACPRGALKSSRVAPEPRMGVGGPASVGSMKSTMTSVHRALDRRADMPEPTLGLLRRVLFFVALASVASSVFFAVLYQEELAAVDASVHRVELESLRVLASHRVHARTAEAMQPAGCCQRTLNATLFEVEASLAVLRSAHDQLSVTGDPVDDDVQLLASPVPFAFPTAGAAGATTRNVTLADGIERYLASGAQVAAATNLSDKAVHVDFVLWNGGTIVNALQVAASASFHHSVGIAGDLDSLLLAVTVGSVAVVTLAALGVFVMVIQVHVQSRKVFEVFLHVPCSVMAALEKRAVMKFEAYRASLDDTADGEDGFEDDEAELAALSLAGSRPRSLRQSLSSVVSVWARLVAPLLVVATVYVVRFGVGTPARDVVLVDEPVVRAAGARELAVSQLHAALLLGMQAKEVEDAMVHAAAVTALADDVLGAEAGLAPQEQAASPTVRGLVLHNLCPAVANSAACEAFGDGILRQGLHTVVLLCVDSALSLGAALQEPDFVASPVATRLASQQWLEFHAMVDALEDAGAVVTARHASDAQGVLGEVGRVEDIVVASLVCMLGLSVFVVWRPVVRRLDRTTKQSRRMLLQLPEEVLSAVPQVMELVKGFAGPPGRPRKHL